MIVNNIFEKMAELLNLSEEEKNKMYDLAAGEKNDLYFVCYMIERVARHIHQRNRYVVNAIGKAGLYHLLSVANVLHAENPLKVEDDWIKEYDLKAVSYRKKLA